VANFWCSLNPILKLRNRYDAQTLLLLCLLSTLLASLPQNLHLLTKPTVKNLLLSSISTALAFFMFSYQVRKKFRNEMFGKNQGENFLQ